MKHNALILALALAGLAPAATAAIHDAAPLRGYSAMAGVPVPDMLRQAQDLPLSENAVGDQPYCAPDAEIEATLAQDFDESLVDTGGHQGMGTALWGSEMMGTWTLVATRDDDTSCIIASGTGFAPRHAPQVYYAVAGLK